ncbi:hypothetical protein J5X84_15465 [Streptosporangiaceae bacterium NEAU-GS5]|nr:hypothetical protein [Streptosporangiaceae bacterium NEAU-GS5]
MKIDIVDLPVGAVAIADDELDVIAGAAAPERWSAYYCTASINGDCYFD